MKLTLQQADTMKPWQWVHYFRPDWGIKECEGFLLAKTHYPLESKQQVIDKLNELLSV